MNAREQTLSIEFTDRKKIIYAPNNEFRHCLQILAAIQNKSISLYVLNISKQWIPVLSISHFEIKQSRGKTRIPINVYIDEELDKLLEKLGSFHRSHVLEKCLALEIEMQISKWGCKSEHEFIGLMASKSPLEILNFKPPILTSGGLITPKVNMQVVA